MAPFSFYTDLPTKTFAIDQITNVDRVNEYRMSNKEFRMMKFDDFVKSRNQHSSQGSIPHHERKTKCLQRTSPVRPEVSKGERRLYEPIKFNFS